MRRIIRASISVVASIALLASLPGCGLMRIELTNRGGFSDALLDKYWFKADTKEMRVLRAYMLIGSLLRISARNFTALERKIVAQKISAAIEQVTTAFICAYAPEEQPCLFFDDIMAELDRSLLTVAVAVLTSEENESIYEQVSNKIVSKSIPAQAVSTAAKYLDAGAETLALAARITNVAASILKAGFQALDPGLRLAAVYRDAVELDMFTVLRALRERCLLEKGHIEHALVCEVHDDGQRLYAKGAGNLGAWRQFLASETQAGQYTRYVVPGLHEFKEVSELIDRGCVALMGIESKSKCYDALIVESSKSVSKSSASSRSEKLRQAVANAKLSDYRQKYWSTMCLYKQTKSSSIPERKQAYCGERKLVDLSN